MRNRQSILFAFTAVVAFYRHPWSQIIANVIPHFPKGTLGLIYRLFHHGLLLPKCGSMRFGCLIVFHLIGLLCFFLLLFCSPQKFFHSCRVGSFDRRLLGFSTIVQ